MFKSKNFYIIKSALEKREAKEAKTKQPETAAQSIAAS
jgi:hypothetical protein